MANRLAALTIGAAALVYGVLLYSSHLALQTNAYDLSVFDYALWSTTQGRVGDVPFFGHSLQAHHFMPTLGLLLPAYAIAPSPILLIASQVVFVLVSAWLFWLFMSGRIAPLPALTLLVAYLFSRRSHSAITSVFYIESLEPLLAFALLLAAHRGRWIAAAICAALLLGCKEDVAISLGAAGLMLAARTETRPIGVAVAVLSAMWLLAAVFVAIPGAREADGLERANPFLEARLGETDTDRAGALMRPVSARSLSKIAGVLGMSGFAALLAPAWLGVAGPGLLLNLMARPDSLQSGLVGHYLWPIIPPLFAAAAIGIARVERFARSIRIWCALVLAVVCLDSPLWRASIGTRIAEARARADVRGALAGIPPALGVLAQPQLIPHLPHRERVMAIGRERPVAWTPDVVLLCACGDQWPLTPEGFQQELARWQANAQYAESRVGPLVIFERGKP
jgi:uncharacterized membrane protein